MSEHDAREAGIAVHTFGLLRMRTGRARIDVALELGATVEGLLRHLAEEYDEGFLDAVVRPAREPRITTVILNGRSLRLPQDLQVPLKTGDELYLIPPIAGG